MSSSAVILFAHGAREREWAQPFESIRDRLRAAGTPVELAFLEFMPPSLDEAAARLAGKGVETVVVVPLFLAQGAHLKRGLPAMVERIRKRHSNTEFRVTPALGEAPEILAAITEWVGRVARSTRKK
jgi:sirohydrochlorin cobaltochelatase